MAGEVGEEPEKKLKKNQYMCNKKPYQKILILVAGVTMNFILAIILFFFLTLANDVVRITQGVQI